MKMWGRGFCPAAGLPPGVSGFPTPAETHATAALDPGTEALFAEAEPRLLPELNSSDAAVIILLPWQPPPTHIARDDGHVRSFLCSAPVLQNLQAIHPDAPPDTLCCLLLKAVLSGRLEVDRLLIRQLPLPAEIPAPAEKTPAALIMAHRGSIDHLRTALRYLPANPNDNLTIRVGLDMEDAEPYCELLSACEGLQLFQGIPAPVGPYAIRQKLAELSPEPYLVFHDSDDVSSTDRLESLRAGFAASDCGLIGCHELLLDEIANEVRAIRYPLDITAALQHGPHYSILHPTCMLSREAFFAAGGFSTDRVISQDTQFHFRAWFHMRMRNLDRFLYIRRKHPHSLTTHPETKIGSEFRRSLERPWGPDFEAIKSGTLALAESTLLPRRGMPDHKLVPLT